MRGEISLERVGVQVLPVVGLFAGWFRLPVEGTEEYMVELMLCLLYTSDAADERSSVDLGGRRIIKKKTQKRTKGEIKYPLKNKE